ncbi:hypothetical protein D3C71_1840630 [compost metagenome]
MKFKTSFFDIEIEWLLILVILISIFSPIINRLIQPFYICYFFILFHEMSHVFIASIFGKNTEKIKLSLSRSLRCF